ncbi:hypothetical protein B0H21DRAFT_822365 [Amylocystis lapponica]|nr:hypothetical protein B0H21DRAFT_822365 [Amylocystis lapponica]
MAHYSHHRPATSASYPASYDPSDLLPFQHNISPASSSQSHLDPPYLSTTAVPALAASSAPYVWNTSPAPMHDQRVWNPSNSPSSSFSSMTMPPAPSYTSQQASGRALYHSSDYPESSQRNVLPDNIASSSSFRSHSSMTDRSSSDSARLHRAAWGRDLYSSGIPTMDAVPLATPDLAPAQVRSRTSPTTSPRIKTEEQSEGSFIFELPAAAVDPHCEPMPEVPLRATQASKEMRRMMSAFRLDPFAMHNGIRSAAVAAPPVGIEIGPLREEPVLIEWQLEIEEPHRSPSPTPEWSQRPVFYPLEDDREDEKWMPLPNYQSFASIDSPEFEPLMTPAQSLNWSLGYPGDVSAQPLSIFRTSQSVSAQQHLKNDQQMHYAESESYRTAQLQSAPQGSLRLLPTRCQQEFTAPAATSLAWYRRNMLPADCYAT